MPDSYATRRLSFCDRCQHRTTRRHCKIVCSNCGAFLDCSDLEIPGPVVPPSPATSAR